MDGHGVESFPVARPGWAAAATQMPETALIGGLCVQDVPGSHLQQRQIWFGQSERVQDCKSSASGEPANGWDLAAGEKRRGSGPLQRLALGSQRSLSGSQAGKRAVRIVSSHAMIDDRPGPTWNPPSAVGGEGSHLEHVWSIWPLEPLGL
ncbi:hypothetical protein G7046_g9226 [Stylonectria norvegica]|nr:hypothetical protein G7046_g9226 [Stylonectria norvegica]